jgi:ABC-2 type transport system ATP-binding protein
LTADELDTRSGVAIRAEGLSKSYRRSWRSRERTTAVQGCGFEVPAGAVAALIGANGAGKTTLLAMLAGLLSPDAGRLWTRPRTAFVSQDKAVYRHLTAISVLAITARLNRVWDARRARDWLERFEVPIDRACGKLSGGQRAQVAFAVALGSRPDVLLADEPLSNLDPLVRREVMAELLDQAAESGMTIVLSTHVVAELGGVADHLLLMSHGRLVASGDLDELLARHVSYVGPPAESPPGPGEVIEARHRGRQSRFLVRLPEETPAPTVTGPWSVSAVTLEDFVLAHLAAGRKGAQQ